MNYARRQQYRRLSRAAGPAVGAVAATLLAFGLASVGAEPLAGLALIVAAGFGLYTHHWLHLAGRSRVGARSEDVVRHQLAALENEGWGLRHAILWWGRGDIDSVAIAPTGIAFTIETKTRSYDDRHLGIVRQQAAWLWRHRRRWCRKRSAARPVPCSCSRRRARRGRCARSDD